RRRIHNASAACVRGNPLSVVVVRMNVHPEQEQRWHKAAAQLDRELGEWVMMLLNSAAAEVLDEVAYDGPRCPPNAAGDAALMPGEPLPGRAIDTSGGSCVAARTDRRNAIPEFPQCTGLC